MDRHLILRSDAVTVCLRSVEPPDCENLRVWKNENRRSFFYQNLISPDEQMAWFRAYRERPDDHMFIVSGPPDVGCMGFRLEDGPVDVHNVIRGGAGAGRRGEMRDALHLMCSYAMTRYACEVGCKVLIENPAVAWYERCGFVRRAMRENYYEMVLREAFHRIPFREEPYPSDVFRPGGRPGQNEGKST